MSIDAAALTSSLRRLANDRVGSDTIRPALHQVIEACVDLFGVTGSGIMLADEQNVTRYVAASDDNGRFLESAESESGQGACTEAFVTNRVVAVTDLAAETDRWPALAAAVAPHGIHAVLGVPVHLGAVPVGTLNVYRDHAHDWDASEQAALTRYSDLVETTLTAALKAHSAGELAGQLQYALDYRIVIERAVGYLMASESVDAVTAFNRLRQAARRNRRKIGDVADQLLGTGRLPTD
jgi:GAF domain-containing protein